MHFGGAICRDGFYLVRHLLAFRNGVTQTLGLFYHGGNGGSQFLNGSGLIGRALCQILGALCHIAGTAGNLRGGILDIGHHAAQFFHQPVYMFFERRQITAE